MTHQLVGLGEFGRQMDQLVATVQADFLNTRKVSIKYHAYAKLEQR